MTNFNALDFPSIRFVELAFQGTQLSGPNTYKWTRNGTTLLVAKHSPIYISSHLANKGEYQVFVSNEFGTLFSRKIKLEFSGMYTFYSLFCHYFGDVKISGWRNELLFSLSALCEVPEGLVELSTSI